MKLNFVQSIGVKVNHYSAVVGCVSRIVYMPLNDHANFSFSLEMIYDLQALMSFAELLTIKSDQCIYIHIAARLATQWEDRKNRRKN